MGRETDKEWWLMVDNNGKLYCRNSVRLITAKYRSNAKWCGRHSGVIYYFSNSFAKKVITCLSFSMAVCLDGILFLPFSNYPISILTVLFCAVDEWGVGQSAAGKPLKIATHLKTEISGWQKVQNKFVLLMHPLCLAEIYRFPPNFSNPPPTYRYVGGYRKRWGMRTS